jgi:hypothetical protein
MSNGWMASTGAAAPGRRLRVHEMTPLSEQRELLDHVARSFASSTHGHDQATRASQVCNGTNVALSPPHHVDIRAEVLDPLLRLGKCAEEGVHSMANFEQAVKAQQRLLDQLILRAASGELERRAVWLELRRHDPKVTTVKTLAAVGGHIARRNVEGHMRRWLGDAYFRELYGAQAGGIGDAHPYLLGVRYDHLLRVSKRTNGVFQDLQWPLIRAYKRMEEDPGVVALGDVQRERLGLHSVWSADDLALSAADELCPAERARFDEGPGAGAGVARRGSRNGSRRRRQNWRRHGCSGRSGAAGVASTSSEGASAPTIQRMPGVPPEGGCSGDAPRGGGRGRGDGRGRGGGGGRAAGRGGGGGGDGGGPGSAHGWGGGGRRRPVEPAHCGAGDGH